MITLPGIKTWSRSCWGVVRRLSGDDAYERYLESFYRGHEEMQNPGVQNSGNHRHDCRHNELQENTLPLTKQEYFKQWQDSKWTGIKRCC